MDNRRKTVLINPSFQFGMIFKFIVVNIGLLILFSVVVYFFLDSEVSANLQKAHTTYKSVKDMLLPVVMVLSILTILISSIIIALFVLLASFRIAGPLYRFNAIAADLASRIVSPTTSLRKHDQLYQCSITLKEAIGTISGDIAELRSHVSELQIACDQRKDWDKASEETKSINEILGRYTI